MKKTSAENHCGQEHFLKTTNNIPLVDLGLSPNTQAAATSLEAKFPGKITFTSGRRSVSDQARVMADNVVKNRNWIKETYKDTPARKELQDWVDAHPEATTGTQIGAGLLAIMNTWDDAKLKTITYHVTGAAFDIKPVPGAPGDEIKNFIKTLPNLNKFLEMEGGLVIWHLQFDE